MGEMTKEKLDAANKLSAEIEDLQNKIKIAKADRIKSTRLQISDTEFLMLDAEANKFMIDSIKKYHTDKLSAKQEEFKNIGTTD